MHNGETESDRERHGQSVKDRNGASNEKETKIVQWIYVAATAPVPASIS